MTHATLPELADEFKKGKIVEAFLLEPGFHIHGIFDPDSGAVVVNPQPHTVATLLHELIHRRHPRWGEARVERETQRLVSGMSDAEIAQWYLDYQKARRKFKRPIRVDQ